MKFYRAILAIAFVLICAPLKAQTESTSSFKTHGAGERLCANWGKMSDLQQVALEEWMLGYVSAYNRFVFRGGSHDVAAGTDFSKIIPELADYCASHPSETVESAAYHWVLSSELVQRAFGPGSEK